MYLIRIVMNIALASESFIEGLADNLTCSYGLLKWTADGRGSALALQLVVVEPIAELAVILHLQMAARIALALPGRCATCKTAQVRPTR